MKIAVFGTGEVGLRIASGLVAARHQVMLGSRTAHNEKAVQWAAAHHGLYGTFADAAEFGELVFNCTAGGGSLAALTAAGDERLGDKILVDVSNPLDFSRGFPPSLTVCNTDSQAERLQRAFPRLRVVKALNTVANHLMVDAARLGTDHHLFVSGNDAGAKQAVSALLREAFGWERILDLGDITTARGTEAWLLLWTRLYAAFGDADFNLKIVRYGERS